MPDLQTELAKVNQTLKEWDMGANDTASHSPRIGRTPTNNVSRETFYGIKHNPGIDRARLLNLLTARDFNPKSVYALVRHMVKQGLVKDVDGKLTATVPEYTPIKSWASTHPKSKRVPKTKVKAPPRVEPEIAPMPPGLRFRATAAELLDTLSITQARELYDELRKIFGG